MNDTPESATGTSREHEDALPELSDERVDQMERALFSSIAADRKARRARRGRWWLGGAAAAAVIVVAAVIAPSVTGLVTGTSFSSSDEAAVAPDIGGIEIESMPGSGIVAEDLSGADSSMSTAREESLDGGMPGAADREIIATASATVVVDDVEDAAITVADAARDRDGYVESMSVGSSSGRAYTDDASDYVSMPYPYVQDGAWISVRVPADELDGMVRELSAIGDVTSTSVDRTDVTDQAVDLRARIDAAEASVDRLLALMSEAEDVADLLTAESALAERQALLESYQQQLEYLEGQVAMSTLTVTLVAEEEPVEADPAGFTDGVVAGWNGLIATLNGIVIALGFLLPWLAVIAIAGLIVWLVIRARRARPTSDHAATPAASTSTHSDEEGDADQPAK
ncbi:DUF4349 domain-containing protein [Microbacterium sp. C7(2022)]|uniref:DUF4349 domain-containing protein n=1 Tax=Microbacterium sp. C7(2022) TaxID=2992759 RepID=UPI00237A7022|nr:DUF4349 domain-containing protein [Microbacterium sp. C7(2022)]MDE0546862.1 DUF4349 domain-containing protein [Microbacterium sp. C7(2022)]